MEKNNLSSYTHSETTSNKATLIQSIIWITSDQVLRKLHISRPTLQRWCRLGVIPCYKLSGSRNIYFIDSEIDDFLRSNPITPSGRLDKVGIT